jgi:hypothetical protein
MPSLTTAARKTTACALAAGAFAAVAAAAPASASAAKGFNLTTGTSITKGKAHGAGSIAFIGPQRVRITGRINDLCPGDGYGAYIEFKINFKGGGYATRVISDQRKCEAKAPKRFAFTTPRFGHRVKSVGVTVIELDQQPGGAVPGDAARKLIRR